MMKITVEGVAKTSTYLKLKELAVKGKLNDSMKKVGLFMQGEVKESIAGRRAEPTSVDTGRFLNSVEFSSNKDSATIFSPVPYAKFLEYGTRRMHPRRHFNNSKDRNKGKIQQIIQEDIKTI